MTAAIADTTVIVHLFRHYSPALAWYGSLSQAAWGHTRYLARNYVRCGKQGNTGDVQGDS